MQTEIQNQQVHTKIEKKRSHSARKLFSPSELKLKSFPRKSTSLLKNDVLLTPIKKNFRNSQSERRLFSSSENKPLALFEEERSFLENDILLIPLKENGTGRKLFSPHKFEPSMLKLAINESIFIRSKPKATFTVITSKPDDLNFKPVELNTEISKELNMMSCALNAFRKISGAFKSSFEKTSNLFIKKRHRDEIDNDSSGDNKKQRLI